MCQGGGQLGAWDLLNIVLNEMNNGHYLKFKVTKL